MKVIVLGDGLLGSEIVKQTGWDYISRKKDGLDVADKLKVDIYRKIKDYDVVVNCIAYTDTYGTDFDNAWGVNCQFLDRLINFTNSNFQKLVHISTDYIYTNSVSTAAETDVPSHLNTWYGYTKLVGDALVQLRCRDYLICRLSHKPYPFPYDNAWTDIKTNGDFVNTIASMVIKLIENNESGIFNVGTETKSIYDMVSKTKDVIPSQRPEKVPYDTSMNVEKYNLKYGKL